MTDPVFFAPARPFSVSEIAGATGAELTDPSHGGRLITAIAPASEGGEGKLVFVEGRRNAPLLGGLTAAAVLCSYCVGTTLCSSAGWSAEFYRSR